MLLRSIRDQNVINKLYHFLLNRNMSQFNEDIIITIEKNHTNQQKAIKK